MIIIWSVFFFCLLSHDCWIVHMNIEFCCSFIATLQICCRKQQKQKFTFDAKQQLSNLHEQPSRWYGWRDVDYFSLFFSHWELNACFLLIIILFCWCYCCSSIKQFTNWVYGCITISTLFRNLHICGFHSDYLYLQT